MSECDKPAIDKIASQMIYKLHIVTYPQNSAVNCNRLHSIQAEELLIRRNASLKEEMPTSECKGGGKRLTLGQVITATGANRLEDEGGGDIIGAIKASMLRKVSQIRDLSQFNFVVKGQACSLHRSWDHPQLLVMRPRGANAQAHILV